MYSESVSINLSVRADFRFGRIDYCDEFCYNTYISIKFGFIQKQFNRIHHNSQSVRNESAGFTASYLHDCAGLSVTGT